MASLDVISEFAVGEPALFTKFKAARLQVAWDILAEDSGTANHAARLVWAVKIFTDYDKDDSKEYRWFLSHNNVQTTGNGISDANCVAAAASFVNSWA